MSEWTQSDTSVPEGSPRRAWPSRPRPRGRYRVGLLIGLVWLLPGRAVVEEARARLEVVVEGAEDDRGTVGIALWGGAGGFPEGIEHALASRYVSIAHGSGRTIFESLRPGEYAVTAFHDANDNQRFDKNWLGLPRERWGVSNDVRPRLRAPRFDEARFELADGDRRVVIRLE